MAGDCGLCYNAHRSIALKTHAISRQELRNVISYIFAFRKRVAKNDLELMESTMSNEHWDIRREGRSWSDEEAEDRYFSAPEKMEMTDGKLYWDDEQRLHMLGLLLENVGVDAAVRLGNPQVWRDAVADLRTS